MKRDDLRVCICSACRTADSRLAVTPRARKRYGLVHQHVCVECLHRLRAGWRPTH